MTISDVNSQSYINIPSSITKSSTLNIYLIFYDKMIDNKMIR